MNPERYLRSFDVMDLLVRHPEGLRLVEIRQALDLPVSSLHNMLQTMVEVEVLTVSEKLRYGIGPRMTGIALSAVASLDVRTLARRHLQGLAREIGDDVYLGISVGQRVFYADRCLGTRRISLDIRLGESLFLHGTATGKLFAAYDARIRARALSGSLRMLTPHTITSADALAAELTRIRQRGYAKSEEEAVEGVIGYAVPIQQEDGSLAAAIHVSVLGQIATAVHERTLIAAARHTSAQIERALGHMRAATASGPLAPV